MFSILQQNDLVLKRIAEASAKTAHNTTLGTFDWVSLLIAAVALIISVVSLIYAIMTLRVSKDALYSQERTEKNTRKISYDTQSDLLAALLSPVFTRVATISAAHIFMETHHFTNYPTRKFFNDLKISTTFIHPDSDIKDNNDIFIQLTLLREQVNEYNNILAPYFDTISNNNYPNEIRADVLESCLLTLTEIADSINDLFCKYYSGTSGDDLDRILSLEYSELEEVVEFPVKEVMTNTSISTVSVYCSHFINCILKNKNYSHNGRLISKEDLLMFLSKHTAYELKNINSWFYDFDVALTSSNTFLPTFGGILLPTPSRVVKGMYNAGAVRLCMIDNELRLYYYKQCFSNPYLTFIKQDSKTLVKFEYVPNTKYYRLDIEKKSVTFEDLITADQITVYYKPFNTPVYLINDNIEELSKATISGEEFSHFVNLSRISNSPSDIAIDLCDAMIAKSKDCQE